MEKDSGLVKRGGDKMELPPGFRFHPTDEELITHYLSKKVIDSNFTAVAIGEADMNKIEPWELPWRAKLGEKEWYFFCVRDKKYPTGLRTNRATAAGYWKATGKDKEIFRGKSLVGMKKTLVFYKGRAPKGEKSNWVTHEYRLEGKLSFENSPNSVQNDWVISRVFHKTNGGKKVHISGLMKLNSLGNEMYPSTLPPLADPLPFSGKTEAVESDSSHVHCFSNPIVPQKNDQQDLSTFLNTPNFPSSSNAPPMPSVFSWGQFQPEISRTGFGFSGHGPFQDSSILRTLMGNYGQNMQQEFKKASQIITVSREAALSTENSSVLSNLEVGKNSFGAQEIALNSVGTQDLESIWSY